MEPPEGSSTVVSFLRVRKAGIAVPSDGDLLRIVDVGHFGRHPQLDAALRQHDRREVQSDAIGLVDETQARNWCRCWRMFRRRGREPNRPREIWRFRRKLPSRSARRASSRRPGARRPAASPKSCAPPARPAERPLAMVAMRAVDRERIVERDGVRRLPVPCMLTPSCFRISRRISVTVTRSDTWSSPRMIRELMTFPDRSAIPAEVMLIELPPAPRGGRG